MGSTREPRGALGRFEQPAAFERPDQPNTWSLKSTSRTSPTKANPATIGQFESPCFALLKESAPFDLPSPPDSSSAGAV